MVVCESDHKPAQSLELKYPVNEQECLSIGMLSRTETGYRFVYDTALMSRLKEAKTSLNLLPGIFNTESEVPTLWPYFLSRLPDKNSPMFQKLLKQYEAELEGKNPDDVMQLLATLGKQVVTDPYILTWHSEQDKQTNLFLTSHQRIFKEFKNNNKFKASLYNKNLRRFKEQVRRGG